MISDQLNKTVTTEWMKEKVATNKAIWDDLVGKSNQQLSMARNCSKPESYCNCSSKVTGNTFQGVNFVADLNLNRTYLDKVEKAPQIEIGSDKDSSSIKKIKAPTVAFADSQKDYVFHLE